MRVERTTFVPNSSFSIPHGRGIAAGLLRASSPLDKNPQNSELNAVALIALGLHAG